MQAPSTRQKLADGFCPVDRAVVEQDHEMATDLSKELAEKPGDLRALDIVLEELAMECTVKATRAYGDSGDSRNAVVELVVTKDRGLPDRAPRFAHRRDQQEAGFVDEDDVGRQPCGVFFTVGQTFCFHSSMADSDRSIARRSGFWWLQPI